MARMVAAWPSVALGEVLRLERRPIKIVADAEYAEIGVFSYGRGIFHKKPRIGLEVGNKDLFLIHEGDFIFQITFAWEGAVALASKAEDGMFGSVRFPTFRVDEQRCLGLYLLNYFRTKEGLEQLVRISPGSAGRNRVLNLKRLPEVMVPLPPLDEQRRIVARIEALAARIAEARGLRQAALAEADALSLAAYDAEFDRLSEAGFPTTLVAEHEVLVTSGPRNFGSKYTESGLRFYRAQDITRIGRIVEEPVVYVEPPEGMTTRAIVEDGDILIVITGATIGRSAVVLPHYERGLVSQHVGLVRVDTATVNPRFLHYCILAPRWAGHQLNAAQYGQGKPGLNLANLRTLRFPLPPMDVQARTIANLDRITERVMGMKQVQTQAHMELDALLPSMLDKAFRGDL